MASKYGIMDFVMNGQAPLPVARGGAVDNAVTWPWQTDPGNTNRWTPPQYAGGISPTMVQTTQVSKPRDSKIKPAPWVLDSGYRSAADLLTMVGESQPGQLRLGQTPTMVAGRPEVPGSLPAAKKPIDITVPYDRGKGGGGYAPWGALSRSLAYNAMHPDPVPAQDPMTVAANEAAANFLANPPDFRGRDKGNAPLGYYGGPGDMSEPRKGGLAAIAAAMKPGATGTATNGYVYENGRRVAKAPWTAGLAPAQQYQAANMRGGVAAAIAPRTGTAGGFSYVNGQKTGYAPIDAGLRSGPVTPTNGAQAYALANEAARQAAAANGKYQSRGGSDVGSGVASSTNPWGI